MPGGRPEPGTRAIYGAKYDNQGMAWLADPRPAADDSPDPGSRPHLAAVFPGVQREPRVSASLAYLGHRGRSAHLVGPMDARCDMARRSAGCQRRDHNL